MAQPAFIYDNYATGATVTGANLAAGQTAAVILQANEDTYVSPAATTLTLTLDLLSATSIACFALAGENLNGITVEIRGSTDNFAGSTVVVSASATVTGFISVWRSFGAATYRYWRVTITGATTATRIYHAALSPLNLLPYLNDGADLDQVTVKAEHLRSPQGHILGIQKTNIMKELNLSFGQVTSVEYALFTAWSITCVRDPIGFFFVPDTAQSTCYFGTVDPKYTYSAPKKNGLNEMANIPFQARTY